MNLGPQFSNVLTIIVPGEVIQGQCGAGLEDNKSADCLLR